MKEQEKDYKLARSLKKGTDRAALKKEQVRQAVFSNIDFDKEREHMQKRKSFCIKMAGVTAAVVLIALFFTLTSPGKALAAGIARLFAPEKPIVYEIEGEQESQTAELEKNITKEIGYVIYIDASRYQRETVGGVDYIKVKEQAEGLPPVQMEISQIEDRGPEAVYGEMLEKAKQDFTQVLEEGHVSEPIEGMHYIAYGEERNSPYESVYVVDNTAGGCFVIRCRMFVEAAEGHGERFEQTLETFEAVLSSEVEE